jgi:predicted AAA+ superfamily ATPase
MMIPRHARSQVEAALARQAAVALIGPRQVGKTTLALDIAAGRPAVYLDLEALADREKLSDPVLFLERHVDKLVILDEIHRMPALFEALRGIIDSGRRAGHRTGRFLILGSAAIDLLRQSGETLAGRIEYVDLTPLCATELDGDDALQRLWVRGGFPESFLSASDPDSFYTRRSFIRTYLERDVPMFGPRVPAETLERLWTMLAHNQGTLLNASRLASGLAVSAPTVTSYIGLLVDLLLVRRLPPFHANVGKRLIKSPKTYVRDSGLVHALLGIATYDELLGHPVVGPSWEGFVIENLLAAAPARTRASFYRTARGAEIDLLLELGGRHGTWAVEIKRGLAAKVEKGFHIAIEDLQPDKAFVVYSGAERYPKGDGVEAIGVRELADGLRSLA